MARGGLRSCYSITASNPNPPPPKRALLSDLRKRLGAGRLSSIGEAAQDGSRGRPARSQRSVKCNAGASVHALVFPTDANKGICTESFSKDNFLI